MFSGTKYPSSDLGKKQKESKPEASNIQPTGQKPIGTRGGRAENQELVEGAVCREEVDWNPNKLREYWARAKGHLLPHGEG